MLGRAMIELGKRTGATDDVGNAEPGAVLEEAEEVRHEEERENGREDCCCWD